MAYSYGSIIWQYNPPGDLRQYVQRYGIVNVGGNRWAVVQDDHSTSRQAAKTLTVVMGRQTALGFIKLLLEK